MKKVVVTGCNGFVGSALVKELLSHDIEVIALGTKEYNNDMLFDSRVSFYTFDMTNSSAVKDILSGKDVDTFFHLAWSGTSGISRSNISMQLNNANWTIDCIRLAKAIGCRRFINAGSIMEIETYRAIFTPDNKPGMGYIYGAAKLVAHAMSKCVAADIGIDLIWAMITNAYGVGEKSPRLVNTTIRKCINGESPHFTAGTQYYDFVYIDDVARALRLIGQNGKPFCEYLIGSSCAKPLKDFLLEMKEAIAPELDFVFGDIPYSGAELSLEDFDCSKTETDTGFEAKISFSEGCRLTKEWLLSVINEESV